MLKVLVFKVYCKNAVKVTYLRNYFHRNISLRQYSNCLNFRNNYCILPVSFQWKCRYSSVVPDDLKSPLEVISEEEEGGEVMMPRSMRVADMPHQIFIIQPVIKWGPKKKTNTTPELMAEEAEALIKTLHGWKVVGLKKISLLSFDKKTFFNKGQLESLTELIRSNPLITGVFMNVNSLKLGQHLFLEKLFNVSVFDRYSIVINIFKRHAVTKEAKLQVSLAEIPYIRSRIRGTNEYESDVFTKNNSLGSGETYTSKRLELLSEYEQKIKQSIYNLRKNRELLRQKRKKMEFPVVAVVGYTNCGKTSLIKCLTDEVKMSPEDKLFATLDVTVHEGRLPCNQRVLYVDTIGFISDIPTTLLEPFVATLEDAMQADVVIHVEDVSHPNRNLQKTHVLDTLKSFNLDPHIMNNIITVGNKCDKVNFSTNENMILVSCLKQIGLNDLEQKIEQAVYKAMNMIKLRMRVLNGGTEYRWLNKEAAVFDVIVDENNEQYVFLDLIFSRAKFEIFKHHFVKKGNR